MIFRARADLMGCTGMPCHTWPSPTMTVTLCKKKEDASFLPLTQRLLSWRRRRRPAVPILHHHRPPSRPLIPARLRPAGRFCRPAAARHPRPVRPCPCDGASEAAVRRGAVGLGTRARESLSLPAEVPSTTGESTEELVPLHSFPPCSSCPIYRRVTLN